MKPEACNDYAEPFRIKVVEPIKRTIKPQREKLIKDAHYNPFFLRSRDVYIDLLTDSGTNAMSVNQWAAMMIGDEAYAGSESFFHLKEAVGDVMGFEYVLPTHQGRAAENILFTIYLSSRGKYVPNNMHFDTTKAHVEHKGGRAVNLICKEAMDPEDLSPFKGNMDLEKLEQFLKEHPGEVPLIMVTITCNSAGGQPVSMENLRGIRKIADKFGLPLWFDACRFAENAYFIKEREPGYQDKDIPEIVSEMMSLADGCTMSAKKDALVNIGGFLACRDEEIYRQATGLSVLFEGFPTYGGLSGRDMEAIACGLREVVNYDYLDYRIKQIGELGAALKREGVPIIEPVGGHAVYLDGLRALPHMKRENFPAWALGVALYIEGGIRGVEIGTVLAGRDPETNENIYPELEMLRLTIPRRVYTNRHMDVIVSSAKQVVKQRERIRGLEFTYEPPILRHFNARFRLV